MPKPSNESSQSMQCQDIVIIGAGIVGLSIARELKARYSDLNITILEKEPGLGRHASGRNSGVLHSGIYYPEGSLKAKVCTEGARALADYCRTYRLPLNTVGKVIVPLHPSDDEQLKMLYQRGKSNGARVELIDESQLKELEPEAYTVTGQALYSPETAVFDPCAILEHLAMELQRQGVRILLNQHITAISPAKAFLISNQNTIWFDHLFNTAGLHADSIANAFDIGKQYTILPFKGLYWRLSDATDLNIKGHIYPVPDLRVPFLGVHFTTSIHGQAYLGPTAVPAFGRENYRLLEGLDLAETPVILFRLAELYAANQQGFREFTHQEGTRFFKQCFVQAAKALVPRLKAEDVMPCNKVGIRAQLLDLTTKTLVMDFLVESGERSTHVLNAISPAFTSAFQFARFVLDQYFERSQEAPPANTTHR